MRAKVVEVVGAIPKGSDSLCLGIIIFTSEFFDRELFLFEVIQIIFTPFFLQ